MRKLIIASICVLFSAVNIMGQNRYEEIIPIEIIDGHIIIKTTINGHDYKFLFDTRSIMAVQTDIEEEIGLERKPATVEYERPNVKVLSAGIVDKISIGNNLFINKKAVFVIDDEYLRSIGISGILGPGVFANYILTINSRDKTITISTPYKPSYMPLKNRLNTTEGNTFDIAVGNKTLNVTLDLSSNFGLALTETDFESVADVIKDKQTETVSAMFSEYKPENLEMKVASLPEVNIANIQLSDIAVSTSPLFKTSMLGGELLNHGILSLDYVGKKAYFARYEDIKDLPSANIEVSSNIVEGKPITLTKPLFFSDIYDYRQPGDLKYKGKLPAIVDFWASWCKPCLRISPILEELAQKYKGQILIYKLNVEEEKDIAAYFKTVSLPFFIFIPVDGEPVRFSGAQTKEGFEYLIKKHLLKPTE